MDKQPKVSITNPSEEQYKTPISITLCYLFGIIGLLAGVIMIIRGINLNTPDAYIGGGFIGGSIMLFTLYYIANDIHFMAWQAEKKDEKDKEYQSFVLRHLQRIEGHLGSDDPNPPKETEHTQYMDL